MQRHARCGPPVLGPRLLHRDGLASVCLECGVDARQQQHAWLPPPCPGAEAAGAAQGARSSRSTRSMSRCTCWTTRRTATGPTRTCARGRRTPPRRCSSTAARRPARATSTSRPTASPTATSWRAPGARGPAPCRPPLTACQPGRLWKQCWSLRFYGSRCILGRVHAVQRSANGAPAEVLLSRKARALSSRKSGQSHHCQHGRVLRS